MNIIDASLAAARSPGRKFRLKSWPKNMYLIFQDKMALEPVDQNGDRIVLDWGEISSGEWELLEQPRKFKSLYKTVEIIGQRERVLLRPIVPAGEQAYWKDRVIVYEEDAQRGVIFSLYKIVDGTLKYEQPVYLNYSFLDYALNYEWAEVQL